MLMKNIFVKLRLWLRNTRNALKLRNEWTGLLKEEAREQSPLFKQMELFTDKTCSCFYTQKTLVDLYAQTDEDVRLDQILKEFAPSYNYLVAYLDYEDVIQPDIVTFADDDGNLSLSYGCIYTFNSKYTTMKNLLKYYGFFGICGLLTIGVIIGIVFLCI